MARTPLQPPPGVELSTLLTVRGRKAAHAWLSDVLGVPVKYNYVRDSIARGEIPHRTVAGCKLFSTQDLFNWAVSLSALPGRTA